nr:hypothetical protein [Tanacetum cinerariifolium]
MVYQACVPPKPIFISIRNAPPTLKDPKFWTAEEKKTRKIDRLARSLLIQGLPNNIYSLIDSNETAKDLWDALERQMRGSEYGEQDIKASILYEYETFKANEGEQLLDTYLRYLQKQYGTLLRQTKNLMDINIDALYNILKQNQRDVNDDLGYKKKAVVLNSNPLALVAEKTNVSKRKEKVIVSSNSEGNVCQKKQEFVKTDDKKVEKKADEKKWDISKVKCYNCKKEGHFAKDCKKAKEINANMVFMAQIEKVLSESNENSSSAEETIAEVAYYTSESESKSEFETLEYYDNSTNYGLFVNNDDDQEIFHDAIESASENFIENHIDSPKDYDKSQVDQNYSEEKEHFVDKLIQKFNHKIAKCHKRIEKANQQSKDFKNQNKDLQEKYYVLKNQATTFEMNNKDLNEQLKELIEKNNDLLAQTKIADQEVLFDKMSVQLVELDKHVRDLKNTVLEKYFKISELEECVRNKNLEIGKCLERVNVCENKIHKIGQTNHTVHMIMPSKDTLYNGRKGIGFETPRYFEKAKDLRPSLYDEKVIGLGYTLMFLTHSDEALGIEEFKRSRENKIEFAYDYGNLNASYANEKINFEDDYFQEIINTDFEKIDSSFQQTSSLKPYVPNVILEKIIIDLEDEFVSVLEKEKENLKTIESLKSNGFDSSENVISESKNQNENNCLKVEKECDKMENPKTSSASVCNDAMNVSCNSRMCDLLDDNNFSIFDDESVRISPVSKMPFRKKPHESMTIIQICLWIIDSGCSKHMTGNRALLTNFVEKFLGTVRFGNNDFAVIAGYGDVVIDGVDLLTGDRSSNLYTIALNEVASNYSTCLLAKASSSQSWLWHQRLSHLNFATINNLVKNNLVQGLQKMKFEKDHLCSACEQGKIHRKHHKSKTDFASNRHLYLLHMDLCGPMRI